ncbi:MAG: site-2 protease family protein [Candidatus Sericytochromatia bacterium]|nr:site-2 protease family protein [Candidatus Sericytochromatia bacterium]
MAPVTSERPARPTGPGLAALMAIGAVLIKLKWVLTALKLGKFTTMFASMIVSVAVYAMMFGWPFAVGFIGLLFIHEMGHAAVLKARGIAAGAPVFIPLFGAAITMRQHPPDAETEAAVGIGGPIAGTAAASLCWGVFLMTGSAFWCALAYTGFFLNLFNLLPVSPLDGGRVAGAISRWLWIPGLLLLGVSLWLRFSPILVLVAILGLMQLGGEFRRPATERARYYDVPFGARVRIAVLYFGLALFLGYASLASHDVLLRLT